MNAVMRERRMMSGEGAQAEVAASGWLVAEAGVLEMLMAEY